MLKARKLNLTMAVAMALGVGAANAEIEISGHLKNESAFYIQDNQLIGEERSQLDDKSHHGDTLKFENSARIFVNGELGEESSWHLDLNMIYDSEGVEKEYQGHQLYTQHDWLKEAYIDTKWGDTTDIRLGKQQVVWGTADGIKLLDIVNPTDYREFSQNTMEDSRIPIWMVNVDTQIGETGSLQFIISEHEENKIPGLDKDGDKGHPYTVQGVDTITGGVNGFLNVGPALAQVAETFTLAEDFGGFGGASTFGLAPFTGITVSGFAEQQWTAGGGFFAPTFTPIDSTTDSVNDLNVLTAGTASNGFTILNAMAQLGFVGLTGAPDSTANDSVTNLMPQNGELGNELAAAQIGAAPSSTTTSWNSANPTAAFEYMSNATFATFNTFAGNNNPNFAGGSGAAAFTHGSMITTYKRDYPDDDEGNFGVRYKDTTESGLNWSVNYFYNYDPNPTVDLSYHDAVTGQELVTELRAPGTALGPPGAVLPDGALISRESATLNTGGGGA
ncbi:MAG: hypothetical protein OQL16_07855, partial [Gammaproteobacteria bacterium]|nr:hypothetical protein [Gammaproteobacteria bacterium]